jgi:hypothetical protein
MAKWDLGRFIQTLTYFDAIPIVSQLQQVWNRRAETADRLTGRIELGTILVAGAMGEIRTQTIDRLLRHGYTVRVIGTAEDTSNLPVGVSSAIVDLDNPLSLTAEIMAGITGVIWIGGADAEKLNNLVAAAADRLPDPTTRSIFDFTRSSGDLRALWGAVDDVVMGGVSQSGIQLLDGFARFSGNVSTENSGGFASVRTQNFNPPLNISNYQGLKLRVKGDGQRYKIFVRTEATWDGVGYAYSFDPSSYGWLDIAIPFAGLVPIFRAKTVTAPPVDTSQIRSIQLMLSKFEYDGKLNPHFQPGTFNLDIQSISAYGSIPLTQLVLITDRSSSLPTMNIPCTRIDSSDLNPDGIAILAVRSLRGE